jgi:hypothetical protein
MRKYLILATVAVGLAGSPAPANAAIPVFDPMAFVQTAEMLHHNVLEAIQWAKEAGHWVAELAWYKQQWDTTVAIFHTFQNITDLRSAAYALGGLTRNFYPEANDIPALMGDAANLWGSAGSFQAHDLYYASRIIDTWTTEMERRMVVTSNTKAIAESSTMNVDQHYQRLEYLRARLDAAVNITEIEAIKGLIDLEGQNLDAHRAQGDNVALLLAANQQVTDQRNEQRERESAEILWLNTAPITDDLR